MRDPLRRWVVIGLTLILSLAAGLFYVSAIGSCEYELVRSERSPNGRYVAERYAVDCGMGMHSSLLSLRRAGEWRLVPSIYGEPAGRAVSWNISEFDSGHDFFWYGDDRLVIEYGGARAPELELSRWRDVEIETRQHSSVEPM